MKKLTGSQIRKMFLEFFEKKGHKVYPSQSLIPFDDPSLLWINSGVATLKKYFDGTIVPEHRRIVNSQKSIRTNDIEHVGKTARHHTFFEMLGNFSIGDYFKKEAIAYAWEFLTSKEYLGFEPEKLYVTIYPDDEEAFQYWVEVGLDPSHIYKLEDNFWEIGEGPCGPNTEIFVDRGEAFNYDTPKEELYPGGENERYLEIWNLVFSQYNAKEGLDRSEYPELPSKNIDTGMGLERIASVLQGTKTNYETDLFFPIIQKVESISGRKYGESEENDIAFRVIADHIRACVFAISDGALPSNEGRGYIIRRLIRRSVKFARVLGIEEPFQSHLVDVVVAIMEDYSPELEKNSDFVKTILHKEEVRFYETLHDGLAILTDVMSKATDRRIDGQTAFKLYDTYGFPIELTTEYAQEAGFTVDLEGFHKELEKQRTRAREARAEESSMGSQNETLLAFTTPSTFVGYDTLKTTGSILAIFDGNQSLEKAHAGQEVDLIADRTPFYAESGGQIADVGIIYGDGVKMEVLDVTKAPNGQHLHHVRILEGHVAVGDKVNLEIDAKKRMLTTRNHTATHLLHETLRRVLGNHVSQAGSYVGPDYLRFDFNHFEALTPEQIQEIEQIVNEQIFYGYPVIWREMPIEEAKKIGAKAIFTEKYGDVVRVVFAGDFSIELCGGCHVKHTSEIGLFKIVSESGIGAGIRRIEAVTSLGAYNYLNRFEAQIQNITSIVKASPIDVVDKVLALQKDYRMQLKEIDSLKQKLAHLELKGLIHDVKRINDIPVLVAKVKAIDNNALRNLVDSFKHQLQSVLIVLANVFSDRVTFMVGATPDLVQKGIHSGELVRAIAQRCGGNGGGRADFAQAGGKTVEQVDAALQIVQEYIQNLK